VLTIHVDLPHRCFRDLDNLVYRCMNHSNGECVTQRVTCLVTAAGGISKMKAAKRGGRTGPTDRQRPMLKDLGISEAEINNIKTSGEASTMIE